jgi:hypothetical protein
MLPTPRPPSLPPGFPAQAYQVSAVYSYLLHIYEATLRKEGILYEAFSKLGTRTTESLRNRAFALFLGQKFCAFTVAPSALPVFRARTFALLVSLTLVRLYIHGDESLDTIVRTGLVEQGRTGQAEQDIQKGSDRTG